MKPLIVTCVHMYVRIHTYILHQLLYKAHINVRMCAYVRSYSSTYIHICAYTHKGCNENEAFTFNNCTIQSQKYTSHSIGKHVVHKTNIYSCVKMIAIIRTYVHTYVCTYVRTYIHTSTHVHTYVCTYTHASIHTYVVHTFLPIGFEYTKFINFI